MDITTLIGTSGFDILGSRVELSNIASGATTRSYKKILIRQTFPSIGLDNGSPKLIVEYIPFLRAKCDALRVLLVVCASHTLQ